MPQETSPSTEVACSHRPPCPGCPRFGEKSIPAAAQAALDGLARSAGLPPPVVHQLPALGHRHRARLAVRGRPGRPKIGLFQEGSHRIVDTPHCPVHHPAINDAVACIKTAMRATGTAPYADRAHRGALRYLQIVVERESERVQVVLVGNGRSPEVLGELPGAVEALLGDRLQGLFFNGQPERSNTILGPTMEHLAGEPMTREQLGGVDVFFPPAAFGQNHLPLFAQAVDRIALRVPDGVHAAELYCGVGAIGLGWLSRGVRVDFNERSPDGLAGLEAGLAARPAIERARARIHPGAAGDELEWLTGSADRPDVVVVDPPRRGLDPALMEALIADPPRRLIYLACGLPALLEELARFEQQSPLRLRGVEAFDFFPFTRHVETLVWLDRNGEDVEARGTRPAASPP